MAVAVHEALGPLHSGEGLVTAEASIEELGAWRAYPATHPRPSSASEAAGRAALTLADRTARDGGLLLVALSGGASAMLAVPADGLTIADKAAATDALLTAGLDIGAINLVRRHLSAIKGGQLAARAGRTVTLAISDVCTPVEDDPSAIGSGPTVGDETTFAHALDIVRSAGVMAAMPPAVVAHLEAGASGRVRGPIAPDDPRLRQSAYWLVASRRDAMRAAAAAARQLGYHVHTHAAPVTGAAREAAAPLVAQAAALPRPACLISSGETTVHVKGAGRGGRNQELALAALEPLAALGLAALASIGTDGRDGPTDAAGAMVDDRTFGELGPTARERVARALSDNDAYPLLEALGALARPGPTGTNVGDLQVVLTSAPSL